MSDNNKTVYWNNGYTVNLGLHLYPTRFLDIGAGLMHIYDALDVTGFQAAVANFLASNKVAFQNVAISSDAFRYNMAFASLGFGNYGSSRFVISVEPLAGMVYSNWVFPTN